MSPSPRIPLPVLLAGGVAAGVLLLGWLTRRASPAPVIGGDRLEAGRLYHLSGPVEVPAPDATGGLSASRITLGQGWIVGRQDEFGRPWLWGAARRGELGACGRIILIFPPSPASCTRPMIWAAGVAGQVERLLIDSHRLEVR